MLSAAQSTQQPTNTMTMYKESVIKIKGIPIFASQIALTVMFCHGRRQDTVVRKTQFFHWFIVVCWRIKNPQIRHNDLDKPAKNRFNRGIFGGESHHFVMADAMFFSSLKKPLVRASNCSEQAKQLAVEFLKILKQDLSSNKNESKYFWIAHLRRILRNVRQALGPGKTISSTLLCTTAAMNASGILSLLRSEGPTTKAFMIKKR